MAAGSAGAAAEGGSTGAAAGTNTGKPARSASTPRETSEDEWQAILSSAPHPDGTPSHHQQANQLPHETIEDDEQVEELNIARFEADKVEPGHRTKEQWLASSAVPVAVNALASKCYPEVNPYKSLAGDLLAVQSMGVPEMDACDILSKAVNAITFDKAARRNHPLTALPLRTPKPNGRTIATPTETMGRLRERFVVELQMAGIILPDTEAVLAECERRKMYAIRK